MFQSLFVLGQNDVVSTTQSTIIVKDSLTNERLSFVNIYDTKTCFYTNDEGVAIVPSDSTYTVSYLGYASMSVAAGLKDSMEIFLSPLAYSLPSITVLPLAEKELTTQRTDHKQRMLIGRAKRDSLETQYYEIAREVKLPKSATCIALVQVEIFTLTKTDFPHRLRIYGVFDSTIVLLHQGVPQVQAMSRKKRYHQLLNEELLISLPTGISSILIGLEYLPLFNTSEGYDATRGRINDGPWLVGDRTEGSIVWSRLHPDELWKELSGVWDLDIRIDGTVK